MGGSPTPDPTVPPPAPLGTVEPPIQPLVVPQAARPTPITALTLGGLPVNPVTSNAVTSWFTDFHKRSGLTPDLPEHWLQPGRSRVLPPLGQGAARIDEGIPEGGQGGPTEIRLEHLLDPGKLAVITGLDQTIMGAAARSLAKMWSSAMELDKAAEIADPDYDPFKDPQIKNAGMENQLNLFLGATSARATAERIQEIRARQRNAEWIERGSGTLGAANLVGGLFGDPLNYLPVAMWGKGFQLARKARAGTLTGQELRQLSHVNPVYGGLVDSLGNMGLTAAFGVAEHMLVHQLDPTMPAEIGMDMLIPVALAGSVSLLTGTMARYSGRKLADYLQKLPTPQRWSQFQRTFRPQRSASPLPFRLASENKRFVYVLKSAESEPHFYIYRSHPATWPLASPITTPAAAHTLRATALGNFTSPSSSPTSGTRSISSAT